MSWLSRAVRLGLVWAVVLLVGCAGGTRVDSERIASSPDEVIDAVVRVYVPSSERNREHQGTGVALESGRLVTALHVFGDSRTVKRRLGRARVEPFLGGRFEPREGASVDGDRNSDVAFLSFRPAVVTKKVVRLADNEPRPGEPLTALLMSEQRGSRTWTAGTGTLLGYSRDRQFFAIAGVTVEGDSGGPVVDRRGRLVGIVVAGPMPGEEARIGVPFGIARSPGGFDTTWDGRAQTFVGPHIICSRVRRR